MRGQKNIKGLHLFLDEPILTHLQINSSVVPFKALKTHGAVEAQIHAFLTSKLSGMSD